MSLSSRLSDKKYFCLLIILLCFCWPIGQSWAANTPSLGAENIAEKKLQEAEKRYERGDYAPTAKLIEGLLYPKITLKTPDQLILAYKLLGICHLFIKEKTKAEKDFLTLLSLRPDFRLDPLVDPDAAVEFFDEVKQRNAVKLRQIEARQKQEMERRRQADLKAQRESASKRQAAPREILEIRTEQRPYWINFVPFGAGQFQNEQPIKGTVLMSVELAAAAVSIGASLYLRLAYPNGLVPSSQINQARAIEITQLASGGLFWGAAVYGVLDALWYWQPQKSIRRRYLEQDNKQILLMLDPQVAGLLWQQRF